MSLLLEMKLCRDSIIPSSQLCWTRYCKTYSGVLDSYDEELRILACG